MHPQNKYNLLHRIDNDKLIVKLMLFNMRQHIFKKKQYHSEANCHILISTLSVMPQIEGNTVFFKLGSVTTN